MILDQAFRFQLSERVAHGLRWLLLLGWLLLLVSLLLPPELLVPLPGQVAPCVSGLACELHDNDGNRLFWGAVVPIGLLVIVGLSHEAWRRLCPLSFVSQLFRALGWQRTVRGRNGRREVVRIAPNSWLGRHHLSLQWMLFIVGLVLRLLVVNSSPLGLALLLTCTLLAALFVGWAYSGKAWCQYFCPMGPVQIILTGPRSAFGASAHLQAGTRITQSMCRTLNSHGQEQSACVACQTPCIDIDAERAYWQTLRAKRGLRWAWYSYPGLVLAFFLLLQWQGGGDVDYLRSGRWAYDATLTQRIFTPLVQWHRAVATPIAPGELIHPLPASPSLSGGQSQPVKSWPKRFKDLARPWRKHAASVPVPAPAQRLKSASPDDHVLKESKGQVLPGLPADFVGGSRKPGSAF